ncbi:xanthine dehydrogenase family protein molybdopterin-binding subunit [Luteolibacter flavescens]|uniref:Xanthine dehydrogenase family protein molybdopterin-binding subunit n=1 Tax=Luteolibacter flavescens TaxID=1859460 RepID=A0ABT3FR15_9BACT|nr:xanthine dehydrogenase family protein molybdopterin-binding subunit [Luteolibacter flavescens]MCW1886036.1 xanthine dehydrogenase family protein molybdopterin-binding subunit [Luteolibacter flavescens]
MSSTSSYSHTGRPANRVDGAAKVTGTARYAAEFTGADLLHGHVVCSGIPRGKILSVCTSEAESIPGVVKVFTHENTPHLAWLDRSYRDQVAPDGSPLRPLHDWEIYFQGQPVALVVASTPEVAAYAASLVRVTCEADTCSTDLAEERANAYKAPASRSGIELPPDPRGDPDEVHAAAGLSLEENYGTPAQHHNPMELFASTAVWEKDVLVVYDKTQGVLNTQAYLTKVFSLSKKALQVRSPFVGGAFGSALRPQFQCFMAVLAALELQRNVKISLTRRQMFGLSGRSRTIQNVKLGATLYGELKSVIHECFSETSRFEDYIENVVNWSGVLYRCENVRQKYELAKLDINTPCDMRAPGATQGVFAFECAIDELAAALKIDPLEFRIRHHIDRDQTKDLPYSSKQLLECYRQGAAAFGWERRDAVVGSGREGRTLKGSGVATGVWEAMQMPASAKAVLGADGKLVVSSATSDIGTGTYTIMSQIAAEALGLDITDVKFQLGDTALPSSPLQGGSWTAASVGTAVDAACRKIRKKLLKMAESHPAFDGTREDDLTLDEGCVIVAGDPAHRISFTDLLEASSVSKIQRKSTALPKILKQRKYARQAHSAVFAEVEVDEDTRMVRVTRVVSAIAAGRIINPKTARSQILGGIVWGIGMALQEETVHDHRLGRIINPGLADYHFPVHADIGDIEVIFVPEDDNVVNPLGVKGLGEIGLVGVAAAVANAVHHATGRRVRDLPFTPDKLL